MGNKASKQARKLPSSHGISKATTNLNTNSPNKIQFQHPSSQHPPQSNTFEQSAVKGVEQDRSVNKNADRIGQVKIEEIPLKLDQNVSLSF